MLLLFLTWNFWIIVLGLGGLLAASAFEKQWTSLFMLIGIFVAFHYFGDFSIITYVKENPGVLWYIPFYFAAGAGWSVLKWYLYLKMKFAEMRTDWERYSRAQSYKDFLSDRMPKAGKESERIIYWINFWPVSMLWTALHEIFEKIATRIYHSLRGVYDNMSRKVFKFEEEGHDS